MRIVWYGPLIFALPKIPKASADEHCCVTQILRLSRLSQWALRCLSGKGSVVWNSLLGMNHQSHHRKKVVVTNDSLKTDVIRWTFLSTLKPVNPGEDAVRCLLQRSAKYTRFAYTGSDTTLMNERRLKKQQSTNTLASLLRMIVTGRVSLHLISQPNSQRNEPTNG